MGIHDSYISDTFLDDCSRQKEFQAMCKLERDVVIGEANWGYISEDASPISILIMSPKQREEIQNFSKVNTY